MNRRSFLGTLAASLGALAFWRTPPETPTLIRPPPTPRREPIWDTVASDANVYDVTINGVPVDVDPAALQADIWDRPRLHGIYLRGIKA